MERMVRFLELAWDALRSSAEQFVSWLSGLAAAGTFDPRNWSIAVWAVLAGVIAVALLLSLGRRRRLGAARAVPELMISHGEVAVVDEGAYGDPTAEDPTHRLGLTLSNLEPQPLQLLELAVRTRGQRRPVVTEAGAVVPPNGAVDVVADLFDLSGEVLTVELFLFSGRGRNRTYRLSAPVEWEPWAKRFRIVSLSSSVTPAAKLASQELRRLERRSYMSAKRRERSKELAEATWRRAEEFGRQLKERRAAASEQRVAAMAEGSTPPAPAPEARHGEAPSWHRSDERPHREEPVEDVGSAPQEQEKEPAPRRRLDFPDEF